MEEQKSIGGKTNGTVNVNNLKIGDTFYYADSKTKKYHKFKVTSVPKLNERYNQYEFCAVMDGYDNKVDFYINNFNDINNDALYHKLKELKEDCKDCKKWNSKK